jgi:uncharacterized membrane protein YbhN (UPF0104 family)
LSTLGALLSGVEWWRLLARLGYRVRFRVALAAYVSAGLGGYLVNAVGPALGCAASLRRHGVSAGRATLLTLIANALGLCGVLVWVPVGLLLLSRTGMDRALPIVGTRGSAVAALVLGAMAVVMILVLGALASAAGSRNRLARRVLGRVPVAEDERPLSLRGRHLLALVPWSAGSWVAGALSLYVVLAAMSPGHTLSVVAVVGSAVLAATIGSLAFFVPEGMGVSDAALVALLVHATGLPATTCVAAAVAVRAVDPLTKVGLLIMLLLAGNQVAARLVGYAYARPVRMPRGIIPPFTSGSRCAHANPPS